MKAVGFHKKQGMPLWACPGSLCRASTASGRRRSAKEERGASAHAVLGCSGVEGVCVLLLVRLFGGLLLGGATSLDVVPWLQEADPISVSHFANGSKPAAP